MMMLIADVAQSQSGIVLMGFILVVVDLKTKRDSHKYVLF